ncbi:hypothetical protein [Sutcliffiella cohnii]|uniref:hypothetical protein n=1 Tax=Sutcliffiella cohnii TaxID=33932 RepID=UPI00082FC936|nr:hypothetical protein [Sutcliffiella cohnii]
MSNKEEKKVKGFRLDSQQRELLEELIKKSGLDNEEWITTVIQRIATEELILENDGIPTSLKRHYRTDLDSLKEAMNLIQTIFINQMNRLSVEKKNWEDKSFKVTENYEEKISALSTQIKDLEGTLGNLEQELQDSHNLVIQQNNKIDGFEKIEVQLHKSIERLEEEKGKLESSLSELKNEMLLQKQQHQETIENYRVEYKEEKDKLNQQIVDLVNKNKQVEVLEKENYSLSTQIKDLEQTIKNNSLKYEVEYTNLQSQFELEKERALLARERELRESLYQEFKEDTKELYEKLQASTQQVEQLKAQLNNKK